MRPLPLFALSLLVLAGCSSPAADDPIPVPDPEPVLAVGERVALPQQLSAAEPNIARLSDGTLFVTAPVGGTPKPNVQEGAAYLWRSRDDGATWEVLRSPQVQGQDASAPVLGGAMCSCDADVVASPDGWVYYTDWWIAGFVGPGNYLVEASPDGGETWTANPVPVPQDLVASMDRQWLVAGPDGFVGLFYSFFAPTPLVSVPVPAAGLDRQGQQILAVFSDDHGQSWTDPVSVVPARDNMGYQIGHPFLAPNGTLMMAYGSTSFGDGGFWLDESEVRLAFSTDAGATWQDTLLAEVPLGFDNLWAVQGTVDPQTGLATAVWASRSDGVRDGGVEGSSRMSLQVLQFNETWRGLPVTVRGDGLNFLPWAAAANGTTAVGWYGGDATGDMTQAASGAAWFAYVAVAPDGVFAPGTFQVAHADPEPVKTGPMCPKGASCGGDRELLDYVSMVVLPDGGVRYAYARSTGAGAFVHAVGAKVVTPPADATPVATPQA